MYYLEYLLIPVLYIVILLKGFAKLFKSTLDETRRTVSDHKRFYGR